VVYPPGSPAASATIEPGDIIAGANGHKLDSATSILRFIVTQHLGTPIPLLVWRHDQMQNAVVRGAPWPDTRAMRWPAPPALRKLRLQALACILRR
jgi:S1-C subfamily serine protease